MSKISRCILNLSGMYDDRRLKKALGVKMFNLTDIQSKDCYITPRSEAALRKRIASAETAGVHWIDIGNYHYVSKIFTDRITTPFNLLLFDHHPDCIDPTLADLLSCGDWVSHVAATNPYLRGILMVGIDDESVQIVDDFAKEFDDLKIRVIPEGKVRDTRPQEVGSMLGLDTLSPLPVYVSLDKDVLDGDSASTNWDQGTMRFDWLVEALKAAIPYGTKGTDALIGLDICGGMGPDDQHLPKDDELNLKTDLALNELVKDWD